MKTKKLTLEAQQICLAAVTEVFEVLENKLSDLENKGLFREEGTLEMEPYNRGYQIKIDFWPDYSNEKAKDMPGFFRTPFLHPGTFFEDYLSEGKLAKMEYGYMKPDQYKNLTTGSVNVCTMGQFKTYASAWVEGMKKQIEEL